MKHSDYDKKDNVRKPAPDLWLESQKEAIRALKPDHAGIVASSVFFVNRSVSPVSSSSDLTARLIDVYEYCNDYDDVDYEEEDAYYDNPVTYFL